MHTCHSHSEYAKESFTSSKSYWKFRLRKRFLIWLIKQHQPPVLTISENTKQRLICSGLKPENVTVLYNGIDIDYWKRSKADPFLLKKELGLNENDLLVGTVARITHDKDLPTFFKVAEEVTKQLPNVRFVIVGDGYGNELQQAKNDVSSRGLENVVFFTGHRTDLLSIYSSFDLFLMTSLTEGLPNTALEAMALEVPIVSTSVGGVPELVTQQEHGLLRQVGDAIGISEAIVSMLQQPKLREAMAVNSRKRIEEKFNFAKRVGLLEEIYLQFADRA
jgi:glycosyltransferase involved in cell wall biosynthesis